MMMVCMTTLKAEEPKGWLWYQDPALPKGVPKKEKKKPETGFSLPQKPLTATERLEEQKAAFEEAKALAILEPTLENVDRARQFHEFIISQATDFQESWMLSEHLDQNMERIQTSPGALEITKDLEERGLDEALRALSQEYGLIYVFREDCPYCHKFAPLVSKFAGKYGFELEGLSAGTGCFEGMNCSQNVKALQVLNPQGEYPILYLVHPRSNEVIPLSRGYASWSDLLENVKIVLKMLDQDKKESR